MIRQTALIAALTASAAVGCATPPPAVARAEMASQGPLTAPETTAPTTTTPTTSRRTTTTTATASDPETLFLAAIHAKMGRRYPDQSMIDLAIHFCEMADESGVDFAFTSLARAAQGETPQFAGDIGYIIGAGVAAFCPRHTDGLSRAAR